MSPVTIFILPPGAFLVLACLGCRSMNKIRKNAEKKGKKDRRCLKDAAADLCRHVPDVAEKYFQQAIEE